MGDRPRARTSPASVDLPPEFAAWRALGMLIQLGVTDQAKLAPARQLLKETSPRSISRAVASGRTPSSWQSGTRPAAPPVR